MESFRDTWISRLACALAVVTVLITSWLWPVLRNRYRGFIDLDGLKVNSVVDALFGVPEWSVYTIGAAALTLVIVCELRVHSRVAAMLVHLVVTAICILAFALLAVNAIESYLNVTRGVAPRAPMTVNP